MKKTFIAMTSITYAMKAKELLDKKGMRCNIIRTPKDLGTGCGYSIAVKAPEQEVKELLERHRIPYKASYTV